MITFIRNYHSPRMRTATRCWNIGYFSCERGDFFIKYPNSDTE